MVFFLIFFYFDQFSRVLEQIQASLFWLRFLAGPSGPGGAKEQELGDDEMGKAVDGQKRSAKCGSKRKPPSGTRSVHGRTDLPAR